MAVVRISRRYRRHESKMVGVALPLPRNRTADYEKWKWFWSGIKIPYHRRHPVHKVRDFHRRTKQFVFLYVHWLSLLFAYRYFISLVIQFQLYESVCMAAGHVGPLHNCDIYRSKEAGQLLRWIYTMYSTNLDDFRTYIIIIFSEIISPGASQSWRDILKIATKGRTSRLDIRPMIEYFRPLYRWLEIQNQNEPVIGWQTFRHDISGKMERSAFIFATYYPHRWLIFAFFLRSSKWTVGKRKLKFDRIFEKCGTIDVISRCYL